MPVNSPSRSDHLTQSNLGSERNRDQITENPPTQLHQQYENRRLSSSNHEPLDPASLFSPLRQVSLTRCFNVSVAALSPHEMRGVSFSNHEPLDPAPLFSPLRQVSLTRCFNVSVAALSPLQTSRENVLTPRPEVHLDSNVSNPNENTSSEGATACASQIDDSPPSYEDLPPSYDDLLPSYEDLSFIEETTIDFDQTVFLPEQTLSRHKNKLIQNIVKEIEEFTRTIDSERKARIKDRLSFELSKLKGRFFILFHPLREKEWLSVIELFIKNPELLPLLFTSNTLIVQDLLTNLSNGIVSKKEESFDVSVLHSAFKMKTDSPRLRHIIRELLQRISEHDLRGISLSKRSTFLESLKAQEIPFPSSQREIVLGNAYYYETLLDDAIGFGHLEFIQKIADYSSIESLKRNLIQCEVARQEATSEQKLNLFRILFILERALEKAEAPIIEELIEVMGYMMGYTSYPPHIMKRSLTNEFREKILELKSDTALFRTIDFRGESTTLMAMILNQPTLLEILRDCGCLPYKELPRHSFHLPNCFPNVWSYLNGAIKLASPEDFDSILNVFTREIAYSFGGYGNVDIFNIFNRTDHLDLSLLDKAILSKKMPVIESIITHCRIETLINAFHTCKSLEDSDIKTQIRHFISRAMREQQGWGAQW